MEEAPTATETEVEATPADGQAQDPDGEPTVGEAHEAEQEPGPAEAETELAEAGSQITAADVIPDEALREPKKDAFKHQAIARRIADLVTRADAPFNVALFGPWGSGKSSMAGLLEGEFRTRSNGRRGSSPQLVVYNAWKLGGKGLHRNFIAHAAHELGFPTGRKDRMFRRGLYQSQRTLEISSGRLISNLIRATVFAVIAFVLFTAIVFGVVQGMKWLDGRVSFISDDLGGKLEKALPKILLSAGLLSLVAGALTFVARAGSIEIDQSAPSEAEEFSELFRRLVKRARKRGRHGPFRRFALWALGQPDGRADRLVFLVDELDRCREEDIVATLVALRTFLDEEHCVFIVAADRDVLERALKEKAWQPTPTNEIRPYYSSASAFLDKIFQFQLELPPLRGRRLTKFARQLVDDQIAAGDGTLWAELRDDDDLLDLVLYALIPSRVRSPRRVKVLLNHFVVAARVAEAREIAWPKRAPQIAKLVALRTEFPNFADGLMVEPRLPEYAIGRKVPPRHRKEVVHKLLEVEPDEYLSNEKEGEDSNETNEGSGSPEQAELVEQHREDLRRYLERTSEIDDPGRDLLYLEAAGAVFDLDPELGEEIERDAPDVPDEVLARLRGHDLETQRKAAHLLADMIQDLVGPERRQTMTVLMGLVASMDPLGDVATPVAAALNTFRTAEELADEHLVGALRVALEAEPALDEDRDLVATLFADERLLADADRVSDIARLTPLLPTDRLSQVQTAIAGYLDEDPSVLSSPMSDLSEPAGLRLIASDEIWQAVASFVSSHDPDSARVLLAGFMDPALERSSPELELAFQIQGRLLLLHDPTAYAIAASAVEQVLAARRDPEQVHKRALEGLAAPAPPADWDLWSAFLTEDGEDG